VTRAQEVEKLSNCHIFKRGATRRWMID